MTGTLWSSDFSTRAGFEDTPWNDLPAAPIITPPTPGSARFPVPAGGHRCEMVPALRELDEGDNLWFSWRTMLGPTFPLATTQWQVITQWKNQGTGSPPLELTVNNGRYRLDGGWGWPGTDSPSSPKLAGKDLGAAAAGVWEQWKAHIVFSATPARATVNLWRNGRQVVVDWHPPGGTLYPNLTSYLKIGYYRDPSIKVDAEVSHAAWVISDQAL